MKPFLSALTVSFHPRVEIRHSIRPLVKPLEIRTVRVKGELKGAIERVFWILILGLTQELG